MLQNQHRFSLACWGYAGIPIFASFVQAVIALAGTRADWIPVIGTIKSASQSVAVLEAAAVVFRSSSTSVLVLFVLVTIAWIVQGASMLAFRHRALSLGATALVAILFFALFVLAYLPLVGRDIPAIQLAGFFLVPITAAGASILATLVKDWDRSLERETSKLLSETQSTVRRVRESFKDQITSRAPEQTRERLRDVAPDGVDAFENTVKEFHEECEDLLTRADELRNQSGNQDSHERHEAAKQLAAESDSLNPEQRAERALSDLESAVADGIRAEFGDIHVVSQYNEEYAVRNLREYNAVNLPSIGESAVQIGGDRHELADKLETALEDGSLVDVARAIETSREHLEELRRHVERREADVAATLDECERDLELAREQIGNVSGKAGERLGEMLLEGRVPEDEFDVPTRHDINEDQRAAKKELHDCRFDQALQHAEEARQAARRLQGTAEFFAESVVATVGHGSGNIPIPPSIDRELVERMRIPFEKAYSADYDLKGDKLHVEQHEETAGDREEGTVDSNSVEDDRHVDDVLYVLRELQDAAEKTSTEDIVELSTESLPEKFTESSILAQVKSFCDRQEDIVSVEIPDDPPGYITVKVESGVSPHRVMDDVQDQFVRVSDNR